VSISTADHSVSPPRIDIPRRYNAAVDLIERNLRAGRAEKIAYRDDNGSYSFGELARRVNRFANALVTLGVQPEQRIMLCLLDTIDFPAAFLGAIKAGVVPVCVNTLLTARDYEYMLRDSRACALFVSQPLAATFDSIVSDMPGLRHVVVSGESRGARPLMSELMAAAAEEFEAAATTTRDDMCFWLYSSGSTGAPKGTVHTHASLIQTAELYARPMLGIGGNDVVFSAAKLFFAYGLGNALSFPLAVGATTILMSERPTPAAVFKRLMQARPTIFCGVPTLYAAMLASPELPSRDEVNLSICTSAGEALPKELGEKWRRHFGVDILDGLGSTEMLHIFLSNARGDVRYGVTGKPVPGYEIRLVDEAGQPVARGAIGDLHVNGPTSAIMYWNDRERSRATFNGTWTKSGDKYRLDEDGYYVYCGRSDDMLKVGGQYVSPIEVESALITHAAVLEAAVIGREDEDRLTKPKAYVVLKAGNIASPSLAEELQQHVKARLAPFKYPRWIEFIGELPKTATGKIQRFRLRDE
jgi:benzoate-CoA ligase